MKRPLEPETASDKSPDCHYKPNMMWLANLENAAKKNAVPIGFKYLEYGTAGFRDKSESLRHVVFRMGALAVLRAQYLGKAVGVMITASHNPVQDNGVKIVDPDGEMLATEWEKLATQIANSTNLCETVTEIAHQLKINLANVDSSFPLVVIGRDTRPSSLELRDATVEAVSEAFQFPFVDCGVVTTPQLHYVVRKLNEDRSNDVSASSAAISTHYLNRYFDEICTAFLEHANLSVKTQHAPRKLIVDCANGVGIFSLSTTSTRVAKILDIVPMNMDHESYDKLNNLCGADFVKVQQKSPCGVDFSFGERYASFDGDADRLVYFYCADKSPESFRLLDGDKIATLLAGYIGELLKTAQLRSHLSMGLVQTAYANGSSTNYICDKLKVPVVCVPTGVKHLHKAAHKFDIGVYFEANGHGTVLFSERACTVLSERSQRTDSPADETVACKKLDCLRRIINPAVGDALTDLLAVEAILLDHGWSLDDWNSSYTDLPSRQLKVKVVDRSAITTEDAERRCVKPVALQPAIDELVKKVKNGRSFVRPSGTEDIVRIYAEATSQASADWLAYDVAMAAFSLAGGVAPEPSKPSCERPLS